MKILCGISGLEYQVQYFPGGLDSRESYHPVFDIEQSRLIQIIVAKYPESFTPIDSYLAFLALLASTKRVEFRVPVARTSLTDSIVAQNMESLVRTIHEINSIDHPAFELTRFVVSPDTKELTNVKHWIDSWLQCVIDFREGGKRATLHDKIVTREQVMERLIKDPSKNPANYANHLAEWACLAGAFPTGSVPVEGKSIPLSEYWKSIIRRCARAEAVFSIDETDLSELIEHCEDTIHHGTIFAHTLMKVLRDAFEKKKSFLGLGDFDIASSTYRILDDSDTVERANVLAMIDSAPIDQPIESNYPSKIAYLRARAKWNAARDYKAQLDSVTTSSNLLEKL